MKITKKPLLIGGLTLGIAGGAFLYQGTDLIENVQAAGTNQNEVIEQAELTEEEATKVATDEVAGDVADMEVEKEDGTIVYEFEIKTGSGVTEVEVDGNSGEVLSTEDEDEENEDENEENEENAE